MKRKTLMLALMLSLGLAAHAQWRVGATVGADHNHYSIDRQYLNDYSYRDRWGVTAGVTGQYNFFSWLGVRADLNWTQKNYRVERSLVKMDYKIANNYLQLPVMASFSFGGTKWRGFCNLCVYGAYWMSSHRDAVDTNTFWTNTYSSDESVDFYSERDKRWDCGLVGGVGVEYRFAEHWGAQLEVRCYYSTTSTVKQVSEHVKDYRYNTTTALQCGVNYYFSGKKK